MTIRCGLALPTLLLLSSALLAAGAASAEDRPSGEPAGEASRPPEDERDAIVGRLRWFREARVGADGRYPADARAKAYRDIEEAEAKGLLEPTAIPGSKWIPLGPSPSSGYSGRVSAIAVHPTVPATVYVGAASGGVWKSTDEGATWTPLTDQQPSLSTGAIALAPSAPDTVYVGTGEPNYSCDSYFGAGLLKSTDAGATWTLLGAANFANRSISRVVVHPTDPATLWVSVTGGRETSFLCANPGATGTGVWKSTDGGVSWNQGTNGGGEADRVLVDPASPATLYAAFAGSGIRKSVDGGASWTQLAGGLPSTNLGRTDVAIRPSDGNLFATFEADSTGGLMGIWRSTDAGGTWTATGAPSTASLCNGYCWYFLGLEVAPDGAVWVRGFDDFRSTNSGGSWTNVTSAVHVDHHAIAFASNGNVWVGNDGGAYLCVKSGNNCSTSWSWTNRNAGLSMIQFYPGASLHPTNANYLMGGTQDNGTNRLNGATWGQVYGGDGCWTAINPATPTTMYASWQYLNIVKSTNGGTSFGGATTGLSDSNTTNAPFVAAFVLCPGNPATLIAGSNNVWRSVNSAGNWSSNSPDPLVSSQKINALEFAASDPTCATYFVGTTGGQVWRTTVGGGTSAANWTNVSGALPGRGVQDLAVDPTNANVVFAGLRGFAANLWRSTDALAGSPTWTSVSTGLPSVPVNAVLIDPSDGTRVYVGTDTGVFRSTNGGTSWSSYSTGLPKVPVFDLVADTSTASVVAFTHGRGAWRLATQPPGEAGVSPVLTVTKSGANVAFSWGAGNGCEAADHGLFRGNLATLAAGYDHATALVCASSATSFALPAGDAGLGVDSYFLAVASNGVEEGSYGKATGGAEIPVSSARCRPAQNLAACP